MLGNDLWLRQKVLTGFEDLRKVPRLVAGPDAELKDAILSGARRHGFGSSITGSRYLPLIPATPLEYVSPIPQESASAVGGSTIWEHRMAAAPPAWHYKTGIANIIATIFGAGVAVDGWGPRTKDVLLPTVSGGFVGDSVRSVAHAVSSLAAVDGMALVYVVFRADGTTELSSRSVRDLYHVETSIADGVISRVDIKTDGDDAEFMTSYVRDDDRVFVIRTRRRSGTNEKGEIILDEEMPRIREIPVVAAYFGTPRGPYLATPPYDTEARIQLNLIDLQSAHQVSAKAAQDIGVWVTGVSSIAALNRIFNIVTISDPDARITVSQPNGAALGALVDAAKVHADQLAQAFGLDMDISSTGVPTATEIRTRAGTFRHAVRIAAHNIEIALQHAAEIVAGYYGESVGKVTIPVELAEDVIAGDREASTLTQDGTSQQAGGDNVSD